MNAAEAYNALSFEQRELVRQLEMNLDESEEYFTTLLDCVPEKQAVVILLASKYAETMHQYWQAKEELVKAGYSNNDILSLRVAYYAAQGAELEKQREKRKRKSRLMQQTSNGKA